ncbi:ADP-ribosylglycohydrolase family protein [Sphingomonas sp. QA11]|uniref:ADP-ribosylglycohydrolase family protein n=1 Tax=Sphingomonas sp. QA11 TaxID=2950605 RepID=UPI00234B75E4|nr:ADP-ribosylglycohydrolase family protein [Sphingomonas sp. QA11]WCM29817.1 ADP-ribosylglycohydrolase family protein [Sphingomonas sp. QA11]
MLPASIEDRAIGALLGLATGDAVGTTLEFSARDVQPPLTDMVGGGPFDLQPGQWTDDTAMALALGYSLVEEGAFDPHDCMTRFVDWYRQGTYSCTGTCFDIGIATSTALRRFEAEGNPFAGSNNPESAGNGSLMRLSPVAIWAAHRGEDIVAEVARSQSCLTHGAQECQAACEGFAVLTARAILGASRSQTLAPFSFDRPPRVAEIFAGSWRGKTRDQISSSGYVVHSLEAALWSVGNTRSFEEAILLAANLGDDADTVAAITGQLAGALYGASGIPSHWRARLAWREEIERLAQDLLGEG